MGCSSINKKNIDNLNEEIKIIWIDPNINNEENESYANQLKERINNLNFICKEKVLDAIDELKQLKFDKCLIICSGKLYPTFIEIFKTDINKFKICPKIVIFTRSKEMYLNRNINDKKLLINHPFYNSGGVVDEFRNIISFLEKDKISIKSQPKGNIEKTLDNPEFNFEYILKKNQLIFPLNFLNFTKEIENKEIKDFNAFIFSKYKNSQITPLFEQLLCLDKIPNEIISKYWIRAYTSSCGFYRDMNKDLRLSKTDNYLIYIQMMYEGVKIKSLNYDTNNTLYRGATFGEKELSKLIKFFKNKKIIEGINLPVSIVYCKSFFSFSAVKKEAEKFKGNTLLILKNLDNDSSPGCASIQDFSFYKIENEILVFPFSCFEVKDINIIGDNDYEITLDYLGKYNNLFKGKTLDELIKLIPTNSQFVKDIFASNIIHKKYRKIKNIIMTYKIDSKYDKFRIFGGNFVVKNKNNCHLIYNNKKFDLKEFFYIYDIDKEENQEQLKIELIFKNDIADLSHMFDCCSSLIAFNDNLIFNEIEITKMNHMFYNCSSLKDISCISKWDTSCVTDMKYMFFNCSSLMELPDISEWDTSNVTNMTNMFFKCKSLEYLPDISNWNVSKVKDLNGMFFKCDSLISKPDLSKWKIDLFKFKIFDRIFY